MPTSPSRRTLTSAAAWAVPVIAVGAAAPALAASTVPCPSATRVSVTDTGSGNNKTRTVVLRFAGLVVGQTYTASIRVTDPRGTQTSSTISFTANATAQNVTFVVPREDNGSNTTVTNISYTVVVVGGQTCTGTV
ncbi:hypothetical protein [Phycicoccus flavus]|uniref:hypothetical protein n=1 Tax=Phycicoccus flavus TaxID=2502783 RepID=UPI000FEC1A0E|nr:hypothetical protein [Phycicoccus flavus]NHA67441.1 hypothetical protein [Phycicoccus flavus]